jgi:hypothetical protein
MKKPYIELINGILQQYYFEAENTGKNDTLSLGLAFIALQFTAKYSGDIETENKLSAMIADCRRGIIPEPVPVNTTTF